MTNELTKWFLALTPFTFLAWTTVLSGTIIFWKWHLSKNNNFDLMDLVCENSYLSSTKFMQLATWAVMSYGFYTLSTVSPQSLLTYAPFYGSMWVGAHALHRWQKGRESSSSEPHPDANEDDTLTHDEVDGAKRAFYSASPAA